MPLLYCQAVKAGVNIMRNKSLDAGKAMAAFGVVFIHVSFPGQTGQIIKALARSAVPFFFMVSGYFCYYNRRNVSGRTGCVWKQKRGRGASGSDWSDLI